VTKKTGLKEFLKGIARDNKDLSFERDFVREIVLVSKEMSQSIDVTFDLGIEQYFAIRDTISYLYEEQNKQMKGSGSSSNLSSGTFG